MSAENILRSYVLENYLFTDDQSVLSNSDSFLEKGILDSTGILEIINLLDEEFGIVVEDEEMIPENLDSIDNILSFMEKKNN
ncbi:MAG: acyl carrier protein [Gammaproteobacteria bacterium]|nr:acyl carrier protein [Gammaproteobacteria bacterium]